MAGDSGSFFNLSEEASLLDNFRKATSYDYQTGGSFRIPGEEKAAQETFCYVMVFPNPDHEEYRNQGAEKLKQRRLEVVAKLRAMGFLLNRFKSRDGDELFLMIGASDEMMEETAEELEILVPLIPERPGEDAGQAPFMRKSKHMFMNYSPDPSRFLFRSKDKLRIILHKLELSEELGGCGIDIDKYLRHDWMNAFFPLHTVERQWLVDNWAMNWRDGPKQPLDAIRNYFGSKIALYFAFLGFYTRWLTQPAVVGLALSICQWAYGSYDENWVIISMAVFTSVWSIIYLEYWGRENKVLAYRWNVMNFEEEEAQRPAFQGELRPSPITGKPVLFYDPGQRNVKQVITYSIVMFFVMCLAVVMTSILILKNSSNEGLSFSAGILNGIIIAVFNAIYKYVAMRLNDWENHETDTEYEDQLITKIFSFQFLNSYMTLYLLAFIKPWAHHSDLIKDNLGECACVEDEEDSDGDGDDDDCDTEDRSCVDEISMLLLTIFLVQLAIGNIQEFGIPWFKGKLRRYLEDKELQKAQEARDSYQSNVAPKPLTQAEEEAILEPYDSPFDDYNEMAIQFGYITLFAAAFPMISMFALVNNLVEIRSDATKLCKAHRRPEAREAEDIGTWFGVMQCMTFMAVTTNCAFVWFSSRFYYTVRDSLGQQGPVWGFIISEHLLFLLKVGIAYFIPDVPEEIDLAMKRAAYLEKIKLRELNGYKTDSLTSEKMKLDLTFAEQEDVYGDDDDRPIQHISMRL
eukprot:TRINITY_DN4372_c0_g1::TRINITY_DN4372_c0_g1_i1::g.21188::m.21188 TRINITY_DN4372_c0_g1::TRINITY_DN4372_c0_g1_i1::g.21188  ORF type:complete len:745 (-),score=274.36,sp/Q14AT5/ANO7_MOUSE/28.48/9e-67,Anoctamin/PF04547.7/1.1e-130,DUF221/PF02714.10/0.0029,DUF221/PF02714.10/2.4e+03 TRINITY_DN4372_c0_g1_i1:308-2542(-)